MAGLLDAQQQQPDASAQGQQAAQPQGAGADQQVNDPILKQIESNIDQQVPPEYKQMYESIVLAGMEVMFSKDTNGLLEQALQQSGNIVDNVSTGISQLIMVIFNQAKQDPNQFIPAAGLASITLMCHALDYWEGTGGGQVTEDLVAQCTKATTAKVLKNFGISQGQVDQTVAAGQQQGGAQPQAGAPAAPVGG